jgi:hypothetical protein
LKIVAGSNKVRGRKKRKKARNQAERKAATATHASWRRPSLMGLFSGPTEAMPAAAAAFDVPTADDPTYVLAAPAVLGAGVFGASGSTAMLTPPLNLLPTQPRRLARPSSWQSIAYFCMSWKTEERKGKLPADPARATPTLPDCSCPRHPRKSAAMLLKNRGVRQIAM